MGNKIYCHPLTIADSMSRYLFAIKGMENPYTKDAKPVFERVFRESGLPLQMHTDNSSPFGRALSLRRMTRLSVWMMEIGVTLVYSDHGTFRRCTGPAMNVDLTTKEGGGRPVADPRSHQEADQLAYLGWQPGELPAGFSDIHGPRLCRRDGLCSCF